MTTQKWGETFLKTGLPLEHLAITTLTGLGWSCEPRYEYVRPNREGEHVWFELDLVAHSPDDPAGDLTLLIECKYHDEQRFWFFLPCTTVDHLAQYGALSAGGDLESDANVLHYAPYVPLRSRRRHSLISLAPKSVWGANVSRAGVREENSVKEALDQLGFAFVPFCLDGLYSFCRFTPTAVIPVIVTTARLFRLRPNVQDIGVIRGARGPEDIADELPWTWCYHAPRGQLLDHNNEQIEHWRENHEGVSFKGLDAQLADLWSGPHWVMVVTIEALAAATSAVHKAFLELPKNFSGNERLRKAVYEYVEYRREKFRGKPAV
jgi:hypothetical protein